MSASAEKINKNIRKKVSKVLNKKTKEITYLIKNSQSRNAIEI
jgi:hypothetical protein